jgi:hypothetical protein
MIAIERLIGWRLWINRAAVHLLSPRQARRRRAAGLQLEQEAGRDDGLSLTINEKAPDDAGAFCSSGGDQYLAKTGPAQLNL